MSVSSILPEWEVDTTVEDANWIKAAHWDLPPYKSIEFFMVVPLAQLDTFRNSVTYKAAVERGEIYDDEWVGDYVVDPFVAFTDMFYDLIHGVRKRDTTFDGIISQNYTEDLDLPADEMIANASILKLCDQVLKAPMQDDRVGMRISGKACAASLEAATNYDIALGSRAGDHQRAFEFHTTAAKHYETDVPNKKAQELHEQIAAQHKAIAALIHDKIHGDVEKVSIDSGAHEAATSTENDKPEPTDAMKEAGNYEKGHISIGGLDIAIENPAGSKRRAAWPTLQSHYGYIKRTVGADEEHVDCFVKPGTDSEYSGTIYIIDQVKVDGSFDEHKVMIGWHSRQAAVKAYLANFTPGWRLGKVTRFTWADFKVWVADGSKDLPASSEK
jgi:hypothetical protein